MLAYTAALVLQGRRFMTHCNYLRRSVEDNVVHADVHLVQKSIVYEVAPFGLLVEQASLYEEAFQSSAG
jgi:hypothetical protein